MRAGTGPRRTHRFRGVVRASTDQPSSTSRKRQLSRTAPSDDEHLAEHPVSLGRLMAQRDIIDDHEPRWITSRRPDAHSGRWHN
jgi:hypothetical protein